MRGEQLSLFEDKYDIIDNAVDESFWMYHAGMADGDGCFKYRNKAKKDSIKYQLRLIDKNIIQELSEIYGVKISIDKKEKKHHSQRYMVTLCGKNALHFYKKVYPYLIEKRRKVEKMSENFLKLEKFPVSQSARLMWLAGYFDAEGSVTFFNQYDKVTKNYHVKLAVRLCSTDLKVLRYASMLINRWFNRGGDETIVRIHRKKRYNSHLKDAYDLVVSQKTKVHLFAQSFLPYIKIKRKINKFKKIINYARFCAWQKWQFGSIYFDKDLKKREKWLEVNRDWLKTNEVE